MILSKHKQCFYYTLPRLLLLNCTIAPKSQWLHSPLFVGLGDAFRCAFLTSDWMCISCHKVCNQTSPCPFYEFVCAVWGIFFVWTFFHMFHSWISSLLVFLFSLCLRHNLTGVFANYPSVCTHSYTFHTQTCFLCEFSCALQAYPLPHLCHKRCTFQLCGHFQCASSKYMLCGTFCHRCYSLVRFLVVFSVVFVETKWTAEFFSTISTLILNVHRSKSGSQLKSLTIFKTVSTFNFWRTLTRHLIQMLSATFYSFSTFWSGVLVGVS